MDGRIGSAGRSVSERGLSSEVENLGFLGVPDGSVHEVKALHAKSWTVDLSLDCGFSDRKGGFEEAEKVCGVRLANEVSEILIPSVVDHVLPHGGKSEILVHQKDVFQALTDSHGVQNKDATDDDEYVSSNFHLFLSIFN